MTQNQEFDFHASIKRLAEARAKCPGGSLVFAGEPDEQWLCIHEAHDCTGYYEPFASLRIRYDDNWFDHSLCPVDDYGPCAGIIVSCGGRGWVPEPDVEKARMRVIAALQQRCGITLTLYQHGETRIDFHGQPRQAVGGSLDTVPFRAAEAWLKEKP